MPYHSAVDVPTMLAAVNRLVDDAAQGKQVFYPVYSAEERAADPRKEEAGLFFFRGREGAPFAVVNPGGGFSYVGSLHESMPHAQVLSEHGYNAFSLSYRAGSGDMAAQDLAHAVAYICAHADELGVSTEGYPLWGGSAGARMASAVGTYGTAAFGAPEAPRAATVVMAYTGQSTCTEFDPPIYAVVGENDGIAPARVMERRIEALAAAGVPRRDRGVPAPRPRLWPGRGHERRGLDGGGHRVLGARGVGRCMGRREAPGNFFDDPDFRPSVTSYPSAAMPPKGAVLLCSGGAFQFRSDGNEGSAVARELAARGYQAFVVDYRLRPFTQEEGALDLARAVRFVRPHASDYGIEPGVMGFSAGGILAGEMLLHHAGSVMPDALDPAYVPDALDGVSADAAACGMILLVLRPALGGLGRRRGVRRGRPAAHLLAATTRATPLWTSSSCAPRRWWRPAWRSTSSCCRVLATATGPWVAGFPPTTRGLRRCSGERRGRGGARGGALCGDWHESCVV